MATGFREPDPAHRAVLEALLGRYDGLPLECDGFARVASFCLASCGVPHAAKVGRVGLPGGGEVPLHWWLFSGGWMIDYRLRLWAGEAAPHGVFLPGSTPGYVHCGMDCRLDERVPAATSYALLAGHLPAVPEGWRGLDGELAARRAGEPARAGLEAAPSGADPAAPAVPRRLAWQSQGARGPGRWTSDHMTFDGKVMLCGKRKPSAGEVFRDDVLTGNDCPRCRLALAKLRAGATGRAVRGG